MEDYSFGVFLYWCILQWIRIGTWIIWSHLKTFKKNLPLSNGQNSTFERNVLFLPNDKNSGRKKVRKKDQNDTKSENFDKIDILSH